jgi:hypothetical protein
MGIDFSGLSSFLRNTLDAWHGVQIHALNAVGIQGGNDGSETNIVVTGNGTPDANLFKHITNNTVDSGNTQQDTIDNILTNTGNKPIRILTIDNHGNSGYQYLSIGDKADGSDSLYLSPYTIDYGQWQRLKGHFAKDGMIQLQGCRVASGLYGPELLKELAMETGVPVQGNVTLGWGTLLTGEIIHGTTVTAYPDGRVVVDKSPLDPIVDFAGGYGPGLSPNLTP